GNIKNIQRALNRLGFNAILTDRVEDIEAADTLILLGVDHFKDAMQAMEKRGLKSILQNISHKPIIGICQCMQLLYENSEEDDLEVLQISTGNSIPIKTPYPVHHLELNNLISNYTTLTQDVYFVHSYLSEMSDHVVAYADYGTLNPPIVKSKNFI